MKETKKTKLCRHCKKEIRADTKICPHCKKKQGGTAKWVIIGIFALAVIGNAYGGTDTKTPADSRIAGAPETTSDPKATAEPKAAKEPKATAEPENTATPVPKDPLGFHVNFSDTYRNDVTGRWRLAKIAEDINIEEYAVDYYNNYFKDDKEVHIIVNFTLKTTTCINCFGNTLNVCIREYVDKEEHDAKAACSGMVLSEYTVNIDTGEIEAVELGRTSGEDIEESEHLAASAASAAQASTASQTEASSGNETSTEGNADNFHTHNNPGQQQTEETYVLNTNTMKIHHPTCSSVADIAPKNYATSSESTASLEAQGYSKCKRCFK